MNTRTRPAIRRSLWRPEARITAPRAQTKPAFGVLALTMSMMLAPRADGSTYSVIDLGTLGGSYSSATGINNTGQIVGQSSTSGDAAYHAFSYSGGTMTDLGTLGGSYSSATGINGSGQIVGQSSTSGDAAYHAFSYSGGTMTDLGTLGGSVSWATGINDNGQIVGESGISGVTTDHAFSYSGGKMTDLGTLGGGYSLAYGINGGGQIVGYSYTSRGTADAFSWSAGMMTDLGTLGGSYSQASGINNGGEIVGQSLVSGNTAWHAFSYSGGKMTDLGTLGGSDSQALGINNGGEIVGTYTRRGLQSAFAETGGDMVDLNSLIAPGSGWDLEYASAINDNGDIVGYGTDPSGQGHAFLLTPNSKPSPAPEWPSVAVYFLAAVALALARRMCGSHCQV